MTNISIDQLIDVAREATAVGSAILEREYDAVHKRGKELDVTVKSSAIDLVTEIDGQTQEAVVAAIAKHFPDHRYIGEEPKYL